MRRMALCTLVASLVVTQACALSLWGKIAVRRINQTKGVISDGSFEFTISPNDRWIVFFKHADAKGDSPSEYDRVVLQILDLRGGILESIELTPQQVPSLVDVGDSSWASDSSFCILPPPLPQYGVQGKAILIRLDDPKNPKVASVPYEGSGKDTRLVLPSGFKLPDWLTCSDCFPHTHDIDFIKKHVDEKFLVLNQDPFTTIQDAMQSVSPDGQKIYFSKGHEHDLQREIQEHDLTLYELDIPSGKERKLVSYHAEYPIIHHLRPAPDGKHLAYEYCHGYGLLTPPRELHVLNLQTGENQVVAKGAGNILRWASTSTKLYFTQEEYISVAEFDWPPTKPIQVPGSMPEPKPYPQSAPR
jgi:hypothetical protein